MKRKSDKTLSKLKAFIIHMTLSLKRRYQSGEIFENDKYNKELYLG